MPVICAIIHLPSGGFSGLAAAPKAKLQATRTSSVALVFRVTGSTSMLASNHLLDDALLERMSCTQCG